MRSWGAIAIAIVGCGGTSAPGNDDDDAVVPIDATAGVDAREVRDPGEAGPWAVDETTASATTSLGTAALTVYTPAGDGPFPLVIVSTGFQIGRGAYAGTCRHLASWGYLVVAHDYTSGNHQAKAAEIGELIDWAIAELEIDTARIATAGHSMGGKVSINAAILDARIGAVVGWDPVDALPPIGDGSMSVTPELMAGLTVPLAVIGETVDTSCAPTADNHARFFEAACAAPAALEVTVAGADHTDWVDDRGACGFACLVCANGTTEDETTRAISRRVTTAWLETYLRGASGYEEDLTAPGSPATVRSEVPGC